MRVPVIEEKYFYCKKIIVPGKGGLGLIEVILTSTYTYIIYFEGGIGKNIIIPVTPSLLGL